ncbi:MAG: carboxypeptidase regulatory-like domain-containing protein [Fibrobacteria bacterium]
MKNRKLIQRKSSESKALNRALMGLGVAALVGVSTWSLAFASSDATSCDVTTGASCKVLGIKTTSTSATLTWTEKEHGSKRYFCYGIGSPSKCALVQSRARNSKDQVVEGLTPQTKYAFKFYGIHGGNRQLSITTGSFTTVEGGVCGSSVITTVEVDGNALASAGDSVMNAVAQITRQSDGAVVDKDTTNASGTFHFTVAPGTYTVTLSAPPFTAPPPYTAVVIANKPLTIPDRIFTGAFAVSGTVVSQGNLDSIEGAMVTLAAKTNPSQKSTCRTDNNGYFSLGATAGEYMISVLYNGVSLPAPVPITVSASAKLPNLVLAGSIGIRPAIGGKPSNPWTIPGLEGYDIRGVQRSATPNQGVILFQGAPYPINPAHQ